MPRRKSAPGLKKLRQILPKSGMTYQEKARLMHRTRRDAYVANALAKSGYQLSPSGVCRALITMFQIATPIFIDARAEGKDLWDMLSVVPKQLDWGRHLGESVFFEFFTCLVEARCRWEKNPAKPYFNYRLYSPAVVELVKFRKAVGDCPQEDGLSVPDHTSWILTDAEIYSVLAGGLDEDEDTRMDPPDERDDLVPPMEKMVIDEHDDLVPPMQKMTIKNERTLGCNANAGLKKEI